jgi:membrane protease YdiL (CAAX protease family)
MLMNIFDIISDVGGFVSTQDIIISLAGLVLLSFWLIRASMGKDPLADSTLRRNNMPVYFPLIPLLIWFGAVSLVLLITRSFLPDLPEWQSALWDNLILCIGAIVTIVVIIFLARSCFVGRLKGFGLDIKTIHRDFFAAIVNLLSIWPLMIAAMFLTLFFGKLILGPDFSLEQHEELKTITAYPQISLRILVIITAIVVGPVLEEMLFRGMFQTMICSLFEERSSKIKILNGTWLAILISSGLFAMVHANAGHWPVLFILALCLGYSYEKSGSLLRPIFIHSFFNAFAIITVLSS